MTDNVFETVIKEKLDECFRGNVVSYELKYHYPQMGERDLSIRYLPVEGPSGIDRVAAVLRDVTDWKRAERALRESEARERARAKELETVLEAVPAAVCIAHDTDCRHMTGNRAAYEQLRVPAGRNISKSGPPERTTQTPDSAGWNRYSARFAAHAAGGGYRKGRPG